MKKLVTILFSTTLLFAQDNFENIKKKGIEYFKTGDFQSAINEFTKINSYKQSESVDFYIARSYYELGMYEKALIVYERILVNEPENKRVKLEIAQTYLMLESYEIAQTSFKEILDDPDVPTVVKENIQSRLKYIDEKKKKHNFSTTLMFGLGHDNNINNTSPDGYNIKFLGNSTGTLPIDGGNKTKSSFYETALIFNHMYDYDDNISFRNSLVFYRQDFTKDKSKKLDVISFSTTPIYKEDENISYGLIFGIDNILYGDNKYLNNYSVSPKITYLIDSTKMYETSIKFLSKKFAQESDKESDSSVYEYQNKLITQTEDLGMFEMSLILGREIDKKNIRYDIAKNYETLSLGNTYKIDEQLTINTAISFNNVIYNDENPLFNGRRTDDIYSFLLGLGYSYDKDLGFGLSYNYVSQDSSQTPTNYNKNVIKSTMLYSF